MPVVNSIAALKDEMTAWRRDIHMHPEIGFEEVRTSALVAEKLESWGIEVARGIAKTGVVGTIRGRGSGTGSVGLRADMDALPMQEINTFEHRSRNDGVMHACGHDGHTAMLLGAARYLAETRNFDGTVHVIFQPAEEGLGGGETMVKEGLFEQFPCDRIFGLHNQPQFPFGTIGVRSGPAMAAADFFDLRVKGQGSHGAKPHLGRDPVHCAAQILVAWQGLVSRHTDALDTAVLSTTIFQAGSAYNVVPEDAHMGGTVRTFRPDTRDRIERQMGEIARGIAAGYGLEIELDYRRTFPPTINDEAETEFAARVAESIVPADKIMRDMPLNMGSEDFSFMLEQRPGSFVFVGQSRGPDERMVHNPGYDFNDDILPIGASLLARLAEEALPVSE